MNQAATKNVEGKHIAPWVISIAVTIIVGSIQLTGAFERFDYVFHDLFLAERGPLALDDRILMVDVDDKTFDAFGWPMERGLYANLLMIAHQHGARVVGFDVLFLDESRWGPEDDALFAEAIAQFGPVVLPSDFRLDTPPRFAKASGRFLVDGQTPPIDILNLRNNRPSHLKSDNTTDGVVREVPLLLENDSGALAWALCVEMLRAAHSENLLVEEKGNQLRIGLTGGGIDSPMELGTSQNARLYFKTAEPKTGVVSLFDVLEAANTNDGSLDLRKLFHGKYVLVGVSAAALGDRGAVPIANDAALTLVHATALDNILTNSMLGVLEPWAVLFLIFAIASLLCQLSVRGRALPGNIFAAVVFSLLCLAAYLALTREHILIPLSAPLVAFFTGAMAGNFYRRFVVEKQERLIREIFGRFVAPDVLEQLVCEPAEMKLQGRRRHVSVLFSDIVGYTTLANSLSEMEVVYLLRDYLDPMSRSIMRHGGTVDKIMGDGIMAFFGDPLDQPKHEENAVACAQDMHRELKNLNAVLQSQGRPKLQIRVGIATGKVYSGNFGSEERIEYTVIGRAVNLAARLESKAKRGTTLICGDTFKAVQEQFPCRLVNKIALKGYSELQSAYEVLAEDAITALHHSRENLRRCPRLKLEEPMRIELDGWSMQAEAENISAGGIFLRARQSFPLGTDLVLRLNIPLGSRSVPLLIEGIVVHVEDDQEGSAGIGVRFTKLQSTELSGLQNLLDMLLGEYQELLPPVEKHETASGQTTFEVTATNIPLLPGESLAPVTEKFP